MTILGKDKQSSKKELKRAIRQLIVLALLTLSVNLLLVCLRNDSNHDLLLWINIISDVLVAWFIVYYSSCILSIKKRKIELFNREQESHEGMVLSVSPVTERYRGFDCYRVKIGEHSYFLLDDCLAMLPVGKDIAFHTVDVLIVEVTELA